MAPTGYGWSTISDRIWIMSEAGATTEVHALKAGGPARLIATLPGKFLLHDIGKDERILAERILGRTQMKGKASTEARERDLSWLNESFPADISPDGQTVLFNEGGGEARAGVYLRRMDGSPAVRLGDGGALALSPDGKWALCRRGDDTILLPTGAGLPRVLKATGIEFDDGGTFYPDGKRVLLGREDGRRQASALQRDTRGRGCASGDSGGRFPSVRLARGLAGRKARRGRESRGRHVVALSHRGGSQRLRAGERAQGRGDLFHPERTIPVRSRDDGWQPPARRPGVGTEGARQGVPGLVGYSG